MTPSQQAKTLFNCPSLDKVAHYYGYWPSTLGRWASSKDAAIYRRFEALCRNYAQAHTETQEED